MNFIERLFGIAPDGGNGLLELLLIATSVLGVTRLLIRRLKTKNRVGFPSQRTGWQGEV